MKNIRGLKTFLAILVSLQFGIFLPLAPVLAQAAQDIPIQDQVVIEESVEETESPVSTEIPVLNDVVVPEVTPLVELPPPAIDVPIETVVDVSTTTADVLPGTDVVTTTEPTVLLPIINSSTEIVEEIIEKVDKKISYTGLMRSLKEARINKDLEKQNSILLDFESFITAEKERLDNLDISSDKKDNYISRLEGQLKSIDTRELSGFSKVWETLKTWVGLETKELFFDEENIEQGELPEIKTVDNPAEFSFNQEVPEVQGLDNLEIGSGQKIDNTLKAFISIDKAQAGVGDIPVLADVQGDNGEIIINSTIRDLANDLNNNPVEIYNFVRANINYEPYYGAKKGNLGCLEEKLCNDVDAASLTISLLRASGIPANYKKSIMVVSIDELQEMLGLDKTVEGRRTVYGVFGWNKVPIFTITNNPTVGQNLDDGDFTNETHFALEWVFPEIYYDYDERGGNIDNLLDLSIVSTTEDLQALLQDQYKKQWIPLDVIFKDYNRVQHEIVAETAGFNSENFWYGFYQYQGALSPLNKYVADLQTATGKNVSTTAYHSYNEPGNKAYEILPPALPYALGSGVDSNGNQILPEVWSNFPDTRKQQVKIQLLRSDNNEVVLENTFFGSEINNKELNLYYEGATEADQTIIDSYGGIHATPAELVDIKPYLASDYERYDATTNVSIGDSLKLRFEYYVNGIMKTDSEKFSTAGNQEGIYIVLSKVQTDPYLATNSEILLRGNVGLAREYLKRIQDAGELYEKSMDYNYNVTFARAVVTQNRILNTVNGTPTTFDFKGLTLDASTAINDWSNRGNYKAHRKDFRLLWGLEASYQEGQIFTDVAGLEGISTVKGLQYAYAHPADYTVHTINTSNENVIDTLALSANTKANMHADVQDGNTIVTPDKFVGTGNWNGIFYVSLDPEWTGTYAIGEQTQSNGGWTVDGVLVASYNNEFGFSMEYYYKMIDDLVFSFSDKPEYTDSVYCNILQSDFNSIQSASNWSGWYGVPCAKMTKQFGMVQHTFVLTDNAVRFEAPGKYTQHWVLKNIAKNYIKNKVDNFREDRFKFNPVAGTYSYNGNFAVYYQPISATVGQAWKVDDDILSKLSEPSYRKDPGSYSIKDDYKYKYDWVLNKLGYPTGQESDAAESLSGTNGYYQNFIGGQVYVETEWFDETFYVPGQIAETFNSWEYEIDNKIGTGGEFGFPLEDPVEEGGVLYQEFENGYRLTASGNVNDTAFKVTVQQDYSEGEYKNLMIDGFADSFREFGFYSFAVDFGTGVVLNKVIQQIVKKFGKKVAVRAAVRFVPILGWAIAGVTVTASAIQNKPLFDACNSSPYSTIEGVKPAYYCGKLGAAATLAGLGFAFDLASGKLNKLFAGTLKARMGKDKIFNKIVSETDGQALKKILQDNPKSRDGFLEMADRLDGDSLSVLPSKNQVSKRLLEEPIYQPTFDGFHNGQVKRRFDPKYNSESANYSKEIAFDMQKLIDKGIGRTSFYRTNDIDSLLQMYKSRGFKNVVNGKKGEIMFVKKLDGTTVLSPREYDDSIPHPFLSKGEDVISAGTIEPKLDSNDNIVPNYLILRNKTGHFKFHKDEMLPIINELKGLGFTVEFIPESVI
ncbi:MAG TPA: hypothetical protein DEB09_00955 [Candidatus Magasanikbacteria bacterium]|nr:hypothetical protein [Candidatus Magasanikbacteria bacterium]